MVSFFLIASCEKEGTHKKHYTQERKTKGYRQVFVRRLGKHGKIIMGPNKTHQGTGIKQLRNNCMNITMEKHHSVVVKETRLFGGS
jgi:hypothetical protein